MLEMPSVSSTHAAHQTSQVNNDEPSEELSVTSFYYHDLNQLLLSIAYYSRH